MHSKQKITTNVQISLTTPLSFKRRYLYRKEKESGAKRLKMIHTTNKRINRASLEENAQRALTMSQDVKIPDGPIVIDKDLLQRIYDQLAWIAWDKAHSGCGDLQKELDSLYPFLGEDASICIYCNGNGFLMDTTPSPFMGIPDTTTCWKCKGTGKNQ